MTQLRSIINYAIIVILGVFGVILTAGFVLNLPFENTSKTLYLVSAFLMPVTLIFVFFISKKAKEETT